MPRKMKVKKVTLSIRGKKNEEHKFESAPLDNSKQAVHVSSKGEVELQRSIDGTQDEKIDLLKKQYKELCTRIAKLEGLWFVRLWIFLNKPIKLRRK